MAGSQKWMDGYMDGWMDGWVDGWMDGWMYGWMGGVLIIFIFLLLSFFYVVEN